MAVKVNIKGRTDGPIPSRPRKYGQIIAVWTVCTMLLSLAYAQALPPQRVDLLPSFFAIWKRFLHQHLSRRKRLK